MTHKLKSIKQFFICYGAKFILLCCFAVYTLWTSWLCDDAYHAFVMARNLVEGNGFVYNVGSRVTATTCPLYTIITALLYAVIHNMYLAGIIQGMLFSTLAVYVVIFKLCKDTITSVLSVGIMVSCYSFMCFTTAGLENSLLFFLSALFVYYTISKQISVKRKLIILSLLISMIAMTRMDAVLIFLPCICYIYLTEKDIPFLKRVGIGLMGLLPFIIWELFSTVYYGYPFPNTLYAKLYTGFEKSEYYNRGIDYILHSSIMDVLLLVVPIVLVVLAFIRKSSVMTYFSLGVALYWFYIISIGGDFMLGRHMTVPFFLSLIGIIALQYSELENHYNVKKILLVLLLVGVMGGYSSLSERDSIFSDTVTSYTGCIFEKEFYYPYTGFRNYINSRREGFDSVERYYLEYEAGLRFIYESGVDGYCLKLLPGIIDYYMQKEKMLYLTDIHGLMDPLLSHLPAVKEEGWRIGHMYRSIPEGYQESLASGTNEIRDKSLHEYYDYVLMITQGDVWDINRLRVIINMNCGKYDYLVDEYIENL